MITYSLGQPPYFVAAADHGDIAGAARALNISQPSIAIAKLEASFGVRLLLRHHAHGVSLTPAGRPLLAEARSLLAHAGELAAHARGLGEAVRGRLDVGCFVTMAPSFFPAIARGFTVAHPEVDIRLHEGHQDALLEGLESGRFMVALLYDFDLGGDLDLEPLADLAPYALLPGDHPLARRRTVALADLAPLPMVLLDMPPSRDYFTSLFLKRGLEPDIRFRSPSFETVRGMVGNGVGYSLLVTRPASDQSYDGRPLACRPLADDVEPGRVVLARLAQSRPTRLVETFADYCRSYFADGAGKWYVCGDGSGSLGVWQLTEETEAAPAHLPTRELVGRILRTEVRPHMGRLALAVLCMMVVAVTTAALAWLIEPVLSEVFENKDEAMLVALPLAVIAVFACSSGANYAQAVLMHYVGQRIIADLQKRLFAHLMDADLAFYHDTETGALISRFTNDVNMMRAAVSTALTGIALDFFKVVFLAAVMFWRDWAMALIACFVFPVAVLPVVKIGRRMRKVSARGLEQNARLLAYLNETFQGARHVKAYGMEAHEVRRGGAIVESLFAIIFKALRVRSLSSPLMEFLGGIAIAAVIFYGGSQVIAGHTTMPVFMSFITALLLAYEPMKRLANLNANLQEGLAATQRVYALLDAEPAITDKPGAETLAAGRGEITFDDVHFAYGGAGPALNGITLTVPAGGTAALVGPSGAGKSTVLNLIPRFYDVTSGAVRIDGVDLRDVTMASLRASLALVSQEVSLFNDTVRDNIAYGRIGADHEAIMAAARGAAADDFIAALPQGYDTIVGEHGVKLSGGQRQRISIARAMLKNAPILLLDEATSSLDSESERIVQDALAALMAGRTTLVIAHRLSTIVDADVIYFIEDGRVAEQGSHAELIAKNGAYARMYLMQYADSVEEDGATRARA